MKDQFLPRGDNERVLWLNNFAAKLPEYAEKFGVSDDDVQDAVTSALYYEAVIGMTDAAQRYAQAATAFKNIIRDGPLSETPTIVPILPSHDLPSAIALPGIFKRMTQMGRSIKTHKSYTSVDGYNMGLEGTDLKEHDEAPVLKLSFKGGDVIVGWKKHLGVTDIEIQVDRGNGWEFLATDTWPDYTDSFRLPPGQTAQWHYRAIYRVKDERHRDWSAVASVLVMG